MNEWKRNSWIILKPHSQLHLLEFYKPMIKKSITTNQPYKERNLMGWREVSMEGDTIKLIMKMQ